MKIISFILALVLVSACSKQSDPIAPTPTGYHLLGKQTQGNTRMELYSKQDLAVGYCQLFVKVVNSSTGAVVRDAHVEVDCSMDMDTLHHNALVEQCACTTPGTDDMWTIGALFHMSASAGAWSVRMNVHNHVTDEEVYASFPIDVAASPNVVLLPGAQEETILCFLPPAAPVVGKNTVQFLIASTSDHRSYRTRDDLQCVIKPIMKSMGHGSDGNSQPTNIGAGRYQGAVNCIMKGMWTIQTTVMHADQPLGMAEFPLSL